MIFVLQRIVCLHRHSLHTNSSYRCCEIALSAMCVGFEDVGHSSDARDMLAKYKIGELSEEEKAASKAKVAESATTGGGGSR